MPMKISWTSSDRGAQRCERSFSCPSHWRNTCTMCTVAAVRRGRLQCSCHGSELGLVIQRTPRHRDFGCAQAFDRSGVQASDPAHPQGLRTASGLWALCTLSISRRAVCCRPDVISQFQFQQWSFKHFQNVQQGQFKK